jgi:type IV pilus assembly protein PilF
MKTNSVKRLGHPARTHAMTSTAMMLAALFILSACATSHKKKAELTDAQRARLLIQVADGALIENDPTAALEALIQAEAADPTIPEIYNSMALAFYAKSDFQAALLNAQKAVKIAPGYPDGNNTLGKILVDLGRFNEAIAPLSRAANEPLYREAYKPQTTLGILYYRENNYSKASSYFEKAIQTGKDQACIAYYYRGHLKLRDGHYSDAIRDYKQATQRMCAGFADASLAIGITYERTRQYDLARRTYLEVEQRFPNTKAADQAINLMRALP